MLTKTLMFDQDVIDVLRAARWDSGGQALTLIGQLDRKLYEKVNKAIEALGGKWNKKAKAHLFDSDPRDRVENFLTAGAISIERDGFFETPLAVVNRMLELVEPHGSIGEPEAGLGAIVDNLPVEKIRVFCIEKNQQRADVLKSKGYIVHCGDFMECDPRQFKFDTIYMNPPFEEGQDIKHVMKAIEHLNSGGQLVSVMSEGSFVNSDRRSVEFRAWLAEEDGYSEKLPAGSFKTSGTCVSTRLVVIER